MCTGLHAVHGAKVAALWLDHYVCNVFWYNLHLAFPQSHGAFGSNAVAFVHYIKPCIYSLLEPGTNNGSSNPHGSALYISFNAYISLPLLH